jgi:hypothetical protein
MPASMAMKHSSHSAHRGPRAPVTLAMRRRARRAARPADVVDRPRTGAGDGVERLESSAPPQGSKTYAIRELIAEVLEDPATREAAIQEFRRALSRSRTVIPGLEFAARVNREIGQGSAPLTWTR